MSLVPLLISGLVHDTSGAPLAMAHVYFLAAPAPMPDIAALTDAAGRFRLAVPVSGTYRIECRLDGYAAVEVTVSVAPSREAPLDIVLPPAR
jgi:hypothetical protein